MRNLNYLLLTIICVGFCFFSFGQSNTHIRLQAEDFYNSKSTKKVSNTQLNSGIGISLEDNETELESILFQFKVPKAGLYVLESYAITDEYGTKLMKAAKSKFQSLFMTIQVNDQKPTKRVVAVPWVNPKQELGKFDLNTQNTIKIWLPKGVILDYIDIIPYTSPEVPIAARNYKPPYVPQEHPRLWVNSQTIALVRANLEVGENKPRWELVKKLAFEKPTLNLSQDEISYDENLEKLIEAKAFYYLMTGDKRIGVEAIDLTKSYISRVSFGNILDITREIGRAIHITSEVYDWCYNLMSKNDLDFLRQHLMRLAMDMEIGWPPFLQPIVNGHGAEAQVCRDLLSMAIAIYDEDPIPYQYCAYTVFEELIPMRGFEYQSPRHNQGINYGAYRINWDLHAAWMLKRMANKEVFNPNIKNTADYWLYFRLPDGQMLRDGDHDLRSKAGVYDYWQINPTSFFMNYSYSSNPYLKHSFEKMNSSSVNPVLFLLLNDPNFKSSPIPSDYPLNKDFGPILGGMVNRTGWDDDIKSNNVIAEIKGGGYYFSNHQHNDVGAIQIYHRGFQVADLGQYKFYGTPYDLNFTKRSVSHSMLLAIDSTEKIGNIPSNDGGTRMYRKIPNSPEELISNSGHHNGQVISSSTGSKFNYFSLNPTSAYSNKIVDYLRNYVFIHTGREDIPALIILKDNMQTASPEIKKYWQVNTIQEPSITADKQIKLSSSRVGIEANTYINFIYPQVEDQNVEVLGKQDAHNVFGFQVTPPVEDQFESNGYRVMVSPKQANTVDKFLTVFQMTEAGVKPFVAQHQKTGSYDIISILNMLILMNDSMDLNDQPIEFEVKEKRDTDLFVTGLREGKWQLMTNKGKRIQIVDIKSQQNTATFNLTKGKYKLVKN